jgi:hypothetical protein
MKKIITIFALIILSGCKLPVYTIGMTEADFKAHNKFTVIAEATAGRTVYKNESYQDNKGNMHYQYFYFDDGKLTRIEERKPDIIVEHTSN